MKESLTSLKSRAAKIVALLKKAYPDAACSLDFKTPHQLLVSTILSAQCTDERVNAVTPGLFEKYRTPSDFARADLAELEDDIRSTGFFRNKARAIKESSRILTEKYKGKMPKTLKEMTALPGVGRKTASVVLGTAFGIAEGIVVDTHVTRLSRRLGFTREKDAVKIETDLMKIIDGKDWIILSHLMIAHGRAVCRARKPDCGRCPLAKLCPSAGKV
ncbi:Endonuclease III [Candidatus Zixiibacteriota bacterium]|nr:Endonuclease III [candidate division Zixibacteria bacterium]